MKKSLILLYVLTLFSFLSGQEIVFLETCGKTEVTSAKKVDLYTGWDNSSPVIFSRTTTLDGAADVRTTSTTTNHVWFPAGKNSDLIISDIPAAGFTHLKLSFDMAAYKLADANVNKLKVYCNDSILNLPSTTFDNSKFIPVSDITLPESTIFTLKFQYSADNNANGYRLDNIRITGDKAISEAYVPSYNEIHPILSGNTLRLPTMADGTLVQIFDLLGTQVQLSALHGGSIELTNRLKKFLYLIRVNNVTLKIFL